MKYARFVCRHAGLEHDVQATLFPSRRQFLRYLRSKNVTCVGRGQVAITGAKCAAKCLGFSPEAVASGDPLAELVFYADQFTPDCIAHEVFHALILVFRANGRTPMDDGDGEEHFACLQGTLTQAILDWKDALALPPIHPNRRP